MEVGLIGSCTNSSYQDLSRAASIARQAYEDKIPVAAPLIINPGSEQIRYTAERDGIIGDFERIGATIMANACGPCIGQWKRHTDDNTRKNSIVTSVSYTHLSHTPDKETNVPPNMVPHITIFHKTG